MASISNIYATGYQAGGHANSSQLLYGGERKHFIEGQEGSNDCGSMIFQISKGGLSSASVITKAYLTYQVKADSHIILNGAVNGTNRWELYRVNSCSASGEAFTITSETKIASNNDQRFTTNSTETSSSEYMKENTWVTRSNQAFSLYSDQSINVNYLKVKWTLIERQDWDSSDMTVYVKDLKLHIEYNERYYARFYNNGTLEKTQTINGGSAATYYTPTRYGYKFLGWRCSADNKLYNSGSLPAGTQYDITYTAEWELGKYTLSFKNADGSNVSSKTVTYNTNIGDLPSISRNGYTFAGWVPCAPAKKTDGNILDSLCYYGDKNSPKPLSGSYMYTNNLSLHIEAFMDNWDGISNPAQQIISCTEGGGWALGYSANTVGHGFEIHTGSYKGVDLGFGTSGKFTNGQWYYFDIVFTNSTLKAYVNGVEKGSVATSSEIKYNSSNTIFVGGEAGDSATAAVGNYFNGLISNVFIANSPNRLAYATTTTKMPGENVNYYPVWRVNRYTVSFNANEGNVSSTSKVVVFNHSYGDLPTPTRTGYDFDGWFTAASGGTQITSSSIFTNAGNQILYAHWTPITYTIQFNSNMENTSGSVSPISLAYDAPSTKLPKNNFRKIDYIFNSWNTKANGSGTKFTDQQSVKKLATTNITITLYAQWDFVGDINYDNLFSFSQWATSENGQLGSHHQTTAELSINIPEGKFIIEDKSSPSPYDVYTHYSSGASFYTIPVKAKTTYNIKFQMDKNNPNDVGQFFVFYYKGDGSAASTSHRGYRPINGAGEISDTFTTPADCTKISMRFGVYSAKAKITFSNIRIYELNQENKINSITNYKHRDYIPNTSSLLNPNRVGYDFNNWINSSGATLNLNGIKNGKASVSAFSQWTPYNYYIEFNGNGADNTGTMSTQTFTYDQSKNLTQNGFSRYRHEFINWNTKADGTGQSYENNSKILNLTAEKNKTVVLYAQWKYDPLGQSIFVKNIPVKKILIDSDEVIEVFINKVVFFRSPKEE